VFFYESQKYTLHMVSVIAECFKLSGHITTKRCAVFMMWVIHACCEEMK